MEPHEPLAQLRDSQASSVRAWISRARERGELFTITSEDRRLIPVIQLDANGDLNPTITPLMHPLLNACLDGWSLWAWLTSPTGRLSGRIPAEVARENPARAHKAADLYAADIESRRPAGPEEAA